MANDLNRCEFIGRLGADPESRYFPDGTAVCNFRIAVGWKGKEKEGAEWIPITTRGKLAEICAQYLTKGSRIYAAGRWQTRKWQDQQGQDRYTTEVVANDMQMLDGKRDDAPRQQASETSAPARRAKEEVGSFADADFDDDIPF